MFPDSAEEAPDPASQDPFPEAQTCQLPPPAAPADIAPANTEADHQPEPGENQHKHKIRSSLPPELRRVQSIIDQAPGRAQQHTPAQPGSRSRRTHPSSRRQPGSRGSS